MNAGRSVRRASFVDLAAQNGRRASVFEQAAEVIQSQTSGNNELAVVLNFRYLRMILAGVFVLLFFLPARVLLGVALPLAVLYVVTDFLRVWDSNWTWKVALKQYLIIRVIYFTGFYMSWHYHRNSFDVRKTQERTLLKLLSANSDTVYANDHKLNNVKSTSDFIRTQPLTKFANYASYVEKMMQGEEKVLTSAKPLYFGKTSGTTGQPSIIPFTSLTKKQQLCTLGLFAYNAQKVVQWEELHKFRPVWKIVSTAPRLLDKTPSGIMSGPVTANPIFSQVGEIYTVPTIAYEIEDVAAGGYIQLLFALRYRNLGAIEGYFASMVCFAFKRMEEKWQSLVENIRHGTVLEDLNIPDDIRQTLLDHLRPEPDRADELEMEFKKGFDNIARRIWPELNIINCITSGPFAVYAQYLRQHYTKDILLYSPAIAATEGFFAVNFWPYIQPTRYALLTDVHFFEFIPLASLKEDNPKTILAHEVESGKDYELVVTVACGINRYRLGDVVRVVSYYNQVPVVEFRHRSGGNLNVCGEHVSEVSLFESLNEAAVELSEDVQQIVDYTSCESILLDVIGLKNEKKGSYYALFVEMVPRKSDANLADLARKLSSTFDKNLRKNHVGYAECRDMSYMEEVIIYPIQTNGFNRLREYILKTSGASPVQLKIPRVLAKKEQIHFMMHERVV